MPHLQVKNVPEETYAALRRRAASEGTTIRDYVLGVLRRDLERPPLHEWLERVDRSRPASGVTIDEIVAATDAAKDEIEGAASP